MGGMGDIWTNLNQNEVWILSLWWFKVSDMSNFGLLSLLVGVLLGFLFQSSRSSGHNFKVLKECTILDTNSNPQKSGTLWAYTTFPLITQKLLTTNPFHRLELITVVLSFLKMFSLKKIFTYFFQYLRISARKPKSRSNIFERLPFFWSIVNLGGQCFSEFRIRNSFFLLVMRLSRKLKCFIIFF